MISCVFLKHLVFVLFHDLLHQNCIYRLSKLYMFSWSLIYCCSSIVKLFIGLGCVINVIFQELCLYPSGFSNELFSQFSQLLSVKSLVLVVFIQVVDSFMFLQLGAFWDLRVVEREGMAGRTLTRVLSVKERLSGTLSASPNELLAVFTRYKNNLTTSSQKNFDRAFRFLL